MSTTTSTIPLAARNADGLATIGRTLHDLRGIRFDEGEGGNAPAGDAAAQAAAAAAAAQAGTGAGGDTKTPPANDADYLKSLREEAAASRVEAKAAKDAAAATQQQFADFIKNLGTAAGFGEQQETDPVKLQEKVTSLSTQITEKDSSLTKAQADIKAANLSTAVAILAHGAGGNAKLLLTNEEFKTSIASVDPTDEAAITAKITAAIQANAALKATPGRSGSGEHQGATIQSLEAQLATATTAKNWTETIRLKQAISAARQA